MTTWVAASKKKKAFTSFILITITTLAAMMSSRAMIFKTRMVLRMTYPGPAMDSFKENIVDARRLILATSDKKEKNGSVAVEGCVVN